MAAGNSPKFDQILRRNTEGLPTLPESRKGILNDWELRLTRLKGTQQNISVYKNHGLTIRVSHRLNPG